MGKNLEKLEVLKEYGWTPETEQQFFLMYGKKLTENYKGSFTIKRDSKTKKWFWYYKFSSTKINPRTKYLCSCDVDLEKGETSFFIATQKLLEKVGHDFSNKNVIEPNLSKYIDEYITICMGEGGLVKEKRGSSIQLVFNEDKSVVRNTHTMKRRIMVLNEFREYCIEHKIKTILILKSEEFRGVIRDYVLHLKNRTKKRKDGTPVGQKKLSRSTIKIYIQSIRMFLNWLSEPKSEDGKGLLNQKHSITPEFQNKLLEKVGLPPVTNHQRLFDDFSYENYEKCVNDNLEYIQMVWRYYCEHGGDIEKYRKERLSYNLKLRDGTYSGEVHTNQPKNLIVLSDVVHFVSFLQLRYGFRITEILQAYRNIDSHDENFIPSRVSSYLKKKITPKEDYYFYELQIMNSKRKDRLIPIEDRIWSWDKPPQNVSFKTIVYKDGRERYETNIIDVIFELFKGSEEPAKLFPSPNRIEKKDKGYSNTYYLNLFKSKLVTSEEYGWEKYGIESSHHLRSYFVSYMLLQDVRVEDICNITGHSITTMMNYYRRINTQMMSDTLSHGNIRKILGSKL